MFERRIEEAALNSWPALQQLLFDGWVMRFAQGYTRRSNSVTPLYPSLLSPEEKLPFCEHFYAEKNLPSTFRLLSFSEESQQLDQLLAQRGYLLLDSTLILLYRLDASPTPVGAALQTLSLATWFSIYGQFSDRYPEHQDLHRILLERISPPLIYAAIYEQGVPVACGLGVKEHESLGIFDVVTDPKQRRKGYGTQLVEGMLTWGRQHGARYAYLQVAEANHAARQMYAKLGFQQSYSYWYRQHNGA